MALSSILAAAASHRTGGERSFPTACDAAIRRKHFYNAPDDSYAKLWFCEVHTKDTIQSASAARPSAGWIIPRDPSDCHPVLVGHPLLAVLWLIRDMPPAGTLADDGWQQLVDAAQALPREAATPSPPPSAQRPVPIQLPDADSDSDVQRPGQHRKRKTPPTTLSPPRPKRIPTPNHTPSDGSEEESLSSPQQLVFKTTNHNRRAHQQREKKLAWAHEQKRIRLGLNPLPKQASTAEITACTTIQEADVEDISWLLKQRTENGNDLYYTAISPYKLTTDMLSKARTVGDQKTWYSTASFLRAWRRHGTPFSSQAPTASAPAASQMLTRKRNNEIDFQNAWHLCSYFQDQMASAIIQYRWAMALLYLAYDNSIAQIQEDDRAASTTTSRNRNGKGQVRTQAARSLLQAVSGVTPSKDAKKAFRQRLSRAKRWSMARSTLGVGILCLLSADVSNHWAEKALTTAEWQIWLNLVKKVEEPAYTASMALDAWLGAAGIKRGPIHEKETLCIEAATPTVVIRIEEVADSDMDSDNDSGAESTPAATPAPPAPTAASPLRQLTLLELFKPQ